MVAHIAESLDKALAKKARYTSLKKSKSNAYTSKKAKHLIDVPTKDRNSLAKEEVKAPSPKDGKATLALKNSLHYNEEEGDLVEPMKVPEGPYKSKEDIE